MLENEKIIFEDIVRNMSDGVVVIRFDGRISLCNQAAADALGCEISALSGSSIAELMESFEENDEFFQLLLDTVYTRQQFIKTVPFFRNKVLCYLRVTTSFLISGGEKIALIAVISDNTKPVELFIHNKRLAAQVIGLMNSFVQVMVTETEARSPYNANHTKKMVRYAERYLEWLTAQGKLTDYTSENTAPFLMSIWLHDIGKLLVPQELLDKPDRLGTRLPRVQHRIETAKLMLRLKTYEEPENTVRYQEMHRQICDAEALILRCNQAGYLPPDTIAQLQTAAAVPCLTADGETVPLLDDDEREAICIVRGTLTAKEREIIESHAVFTRELLSKMEFRGEYRNVPFWAAGHHEFLDGSGYPAHLRGGEIPWEIRLLTVIDIYDALTADDRPYKPPLSPERAFAVLREMAGEGKLDGEVLESFFVSGAWETKQEENRK